MASTQMSASTSPSTCASSPFSGSGASPSTALKKPGLPPRRPSTKAMILQEQQQHQPQRLQRADTADAAVFALHNPAAPASSRAVDLYRDRINSWAPGRSAQFPPPPPPSATRSMVVPPTVAVPAHSMDAKTTAKLEKEMAHAAKVVDTFFSPKLLKDQSIPHELLVEAYGLVFLTVYKLGFLFSGKAGTGFIISRTTAGWSAPSFLASGGLGFGMMAGGEVVHYMVILNSRSAVKVFTRNGQVQLGSELDLAVGPIGRAASASVNVGAGGIAPNYSYSHSKGLYGGIGLSSGVICTRKSLNARCYGPNVTVRQLLSGDVPCPLALPLWQALDRSLGVRREYANGLPVLAPGVAGVGCDTCGFLNATETHVCARCHNLLVYSIGVHSGRRNTSQLVASTSNEVRVA
jgi:lipid-binding SYLF domain-containing protein